MEAKTEVRRDFNALNETGILQTFQRDLEAFERYLRTFPGREAP